MNHCGLSNVFMLWSLLEHNFNPHTGYYNGVKLWPAWHCNAEGLLFCSCGLFFFFRRLISEVTERITTKLGHTFTYDCYLKNFVWTAPGIYPQGLGAKILLFVTIFERPSISLQQLERNLSIYTDSPLCLRNLVNIGPETTENGWQVFAYP